MADPGLQLGSVTETCRHFAARPLGYEAKSAGEPATASLADSPGLRQLLEAHGVTGADEVVAMGHWRPRCWTSRGPGKTTRTSR